MRAAKLFLAILGLLWTPLAMAQQAGAPQAGSLVSADPVVDTPGGMQAWRIVYWTRSEDNRPLRVTGMVVAPREGQPLKPRPVVAWAHGTSGVVERCALSSNPDFFAATPALAELIRSGYVVAAPDYPGLGSSMPHGYLAGRETARSVLDAVRATQQISGAYAGRRFAVWGESQGGHAALWTAAEAGAYVPELTLVGAAAAAPTTDLVENSRRVTDPNVKALLTSYLAYSWSQRFGAPLATLFGPVNRGVVTRLARNNCVELNASPKIGTILGIVSIRNALKNKDIGAIEPWRSLARRNSLAARAVPGSVLIAQSVNDPIVAPDVTRAFARQLCHAGRRVAFVTLPGGDHAHSARDSAAPTLAWFNDRFAGRPAPNDCRKI